MRQDPVKSPGDPGDGQTRFDLAWRTLVALAGEYRIVDETVMEQTAARRWGEAVWSGSHTQPGVVFGGSGGRVVWPKGQSRRPLAWRVGPKEGPVNRHLDLHLN